MIGEAVRILKKRSPVPKARDGGNVAPGDDPNSSTGNGTLCSAVPTLRSKKPEPQTVSLVLRLRNDSATQFPTSSPKLMLNHSALRTH